MSYNEEGCGNSFIIIITIIIIETGCMYNNSTVLYHAYRILMH